MIHVAGRTETYHDRPGLDELRGEAFPVISAAVVVSTWFASIAALPNVSEGAVVLPLLVAAIGIGASRLLPRSVRLAASLFVGGLFLSVVAAIWLYPNTLVACLLAPVVLVTGLLLGPAIGGLIAVSGSGVVLFAVRGDPSVISVPTMTMALVLIWSTTVLSWLASRSVYLALDWSWHSYLHAVDKVRELQERQGELNRAVKSLNDAYYRLEQVNAELERARAAAQEARQHKAEFATTITHELRTPLNLIIGFSEMMATAPHSYAGELLPPDYQCDVDAIYRNARHLSNLIDDILDLGQIEAGRMALLREPADLREIVDGAVSAVRGMFEGRGLELAVVLPNDLPQLYVDPTRIRQVLINLLNNAARFTERGGVQVRAGVADGHVVVSVADTGPGIAPADLATVFDEFRQVDGSIRRRYGGSGLGLAICKSFVELHGGNIWVESTLGHGSTFAFSVPLQANVVTVPARSEWETWVGPGMGQGEATRVVAVIDDELVVGKMLRRYLDHWRVVVVRDAAGLRRLLRSAAPAPLEAVIHIVTEGANHEPALCRALPAGIPLVTCSLVKRQPLPGGENVFAYLEKPVLSDQVAAVLRRLRHVRNVLIVDDDPEMIRLLARMVRAVSRRAQIRGAYGGAEALAALADGRPDVVFLDLVMPSINGEAVLARVNADERLRNVPVVVITGRGGQTESLVTSSVTIERDDGLSATELMRLDQAILNAFRRTGRTDDRELQEVLVE